MKQFGIYFYNHSRGSVTAKKERFQKFVWQNYEQMSVNITFDQSYLVYNNVLKMLAH